MAKRVTRQVVQVLTLHPDLQDVEPLDLQIILPPFVRANWNIACTVETEWQTDVVHSRETLAEDRRGLRLRPVRTFDALVSGLSQKQSYAVAEYALSLVRDRNAMPIYCDRTQTTAQANSGQNLIACDTNYRRFYAGQRVAIVPSDFSTFAYDGIDGRALYGLIEYVQSDLLALEQNLQVTVPAGSFVYPMVDCHLDLGTQLDVLNANIAEARISYREIAGMSTLPSSWVGPLSAFFWLNDIDGRAIVTLRGNIDSDPERVSPVRDGAAVNSGRDASVYGAGTRGRMRFDFGHATTSRAKAWEIIRFFDACRGRVGTFWYPNQMTLWSAPFGLSSLAYVDVLPFGYPMQIQTLYPSVCVQLVDGTAYVRSVDSVEELNVSGVDVHRIHFDIPLPVTASAAIDRVTSAHLCRMASDANREAWITDEHCIFHLSFLELPTERAVVFSGA